jgi:hypothetical protein
MVLAIEPLLVPTIEGSFQGKVEEVSVRAVLNANVVNHLTLGGVGLVFQKEIMFE